MPLTRLTDADLTITPITPQFLSIASSTLGNFGENNDGFDAIMLVPTSAFNDDVDSISELDQHLIDMDFGDGEFGDVSVNPVISTVQGFNDAGDVLLGAFNGTVSPPDPQPNPNPDPNPPPTGGGVGSGGHPPPSGGGTGTGDIVCSVVSNPVTHEVIGTKCEQVGGTGGGIHGTLQE